MMNSDIVPSNDKVVIKNLGLGFTNVTFYSREDDDRTIRTKETETMTNKWKSDANSVSGSSLN